nr:hypothetical protein [Allomuricauda sp.]
MISVLLHLKNNSRSILKYLGWRRFPIIALIFIGFFLMAFYELPPISSFMDFGARQKATSGKKDLTQTYESITLKGQGAIELSFDLKAGEFYWYPQMAVWMEDMMGNHVETLYVTNATAKGLFFGGRSKENFKEFDRESNQNGEYRRVNALPVWSHKRGITYTDGMYVPTREQPLPEAISGATPSQNFYLTTATDFKKPFVLRMEINVAFDDNEYYSEFDFPEDEVFHSGTGQLGQPSLVYEAKIDFSKSNQYVVMQLIGRGHHSGKTGEIFDDLQTLTSAKQIAERVVVGINRR